MRITGQMMTHGFMQNLSTNLRNMDVVQRRLSSGKQINRPSDDPVKLQQILKLDTAIDQREQYIRNMDDADSWLTAADAALNQVGVILTRASTLGNAGLNSTYDQEQMDAMAMEVKQLLEQLVEVGNTVHAGRYIFAGSDTASRPYTLSYSPDDKAVVVHTGLLNGIEYEIGQGITMKVNTTGQNAFGGATGTEAFEVLEELRQGMLADDKDRIGDAMSRLETASDTALAARADIGARMNRLTATKSRYVDDIINLEALKSQSEDADIAEVVMDLKTQETVYRAALAAGARIMQPSLLDYLR